MKYKSILFSPWLLKSQVTGVFKYNNYSVATSQSRGPITPLITTREPPSTAQSILIAGKFQLA